MFDGISAKAREQAHEASFRFLPEIERIDYANKSAADIKAEMLENAAKIMDAQADFLQALIDRCKAASITHEELVKRLTANHGTCRLAARAMRSEP